MSAGRECCDKWARARAEALERAEREEARAEMLGQALAWALYWIARQAMVPLPDDLEGEWECWADARKALKAFGPEAAASSNVRQLPARDWMTPSFRR